MKLGAFARKGLRRTAGIRQNLLAHLWEGARGAGVTWPETKKERLNAGKEKKRR